MRRTICALLVAATLVLTGCWDAAEVSGGIFAVNAALDVGQGAQLRLTLLFPQVTAVGREPTKGEEEQQKNGYGVSSVEGDTLTDCLRKMQLVTPREMSLKQLRGVFLSEELVQDADLLRDCIALLADSRSVRSTALVYVARGSAEAVLREQMPLFGARLSKSQAAQHDALREMGVIPTVTLSSFARQQKEGSALAALAAVNSGEALGQAAQQSEQAAACLAGELPRATVDKVDLCGSAVLGPGGALLLDGYETQLYNLLRGTLRRMDVTVGGETAVVRIRKAPSIRVETAQESTLVTVRLPIRAEAADGAKYTARVQQDVAALLVKLQAAGVDPVGIQDRARMKVKDAAEWQELRWQERYPAAVWRVEIE